MNSTVAQINSTSPFSPPDPPPGNLPGALTSFIGRDQELAAVRQLLSEYRLLTLTGPGGAGKTRLALQVADELRWRVHDGIWLVELAALAGEGLVPQALATALGVREQVGHTLAESLVAHLHRRETLLLLDNCEHLLDACARLSATLLAACPGVRLLATSREPLGVPGEGVWGVPPLSLPAPQPWRGPASGRESVATYEQSEAIQLFVARARAAAPSFELTVENGPWLAEICRRLDGVPLAIELAAARVRLLSVRQIAGHLDDRFQLLTSRLRTIPHRHQTLGATLDWSYELLSDKERIVLRRLAVFAAGWTLDAAQAVCADDAIATTEVMDLLANLVDKSLVVVESQPGRRRYHYLETIRQYARQKLAAAGEGDATRDRFVAYMLRWTEAGTPHLYAAGQPEWLARFDAEHDNLRAALDWSLDNPALAVDGLRLAAACWKYWRLRGLFSEGRERLAAVLGRVEAGEPGEARAWALLRASNLAYVQSDFPAVGPPAQEALAIFRQLGPAGRSGVGYTLDALAELATEMGHYEAVPAMFEEALEIFRELGDDFGAADMLMQLGWAAMRVGDYDRADALLNESLPRLRRLSDRHMLGFALSGVGELAIRRGRLERANAFLEESLAVRREIDERWGIAASLGSLGWAALQQRDFERTQRYLAESLAIRAALGDHGGMAWCLEKLAEAATVAAQALPAAAHDRAQRRAVALFGAADALRQPLHSAIDPADQPDYERRLHTLRAALGEEAFGVAWDEGARLSPEAVLELALLPPPPVPPAASSRPKADYGGLTLRERETAALIAQGKSNREIAAQMTVGVKTVETYVTRILNKLSFVSRVQIAVWAIEKGLAETSEDQTSGPVL